ncbi:MAG TPA: deoxynucleoside kinase [Cellvibrionaceae bacterium]
MKSATKAPGYIAVEGPIGVGKTSLVKRLAESLGYETLLEEAKTNPFLDDFYQSPRAMAFQTQVYFLLQRARQLRQLVAAPKRLVADFLLDKDPLFAAITLSEPELALYEEIFQQLHLNAPAPDLVIYLQAPPEVLLERIHKRGIRSESYITKSYVDSLNTAYSELFHYYNKAPVLIVNAADIDWVNNQNDYEQLLKHILNTGKGRQYFNPQKL